MRWPLITVLGLLLCVGGSQAEDQPAGTPADATPAPSVSLDDATKAKLDKIMATQEDILKRLDAMSQELYVINIRASQR